MIPKVGLMEVQTAELKKSNVASNALSLKCCDEEGDACCLSFRGSQAAPQKAEAKQGGLNWVKVGLASAVGAVLAYAYSKFAQPLANKKWAELGVEDLRNTLTTAVNKMSAKEYAKIRIPVEEIKYPLTLMDIEQGIRSEIAEAKAVGDQELVNKLIKGLDSEKLDSVLKSTNEALKEEGSSAKAIAETRRKNFVKYVKPEELAQYKAEFVESLKTMESKDLLALVNKMTSSKKGIMAVGAAVLGLGYIAYEKFVKKA